ncbi:LAQU0S08e02366g1_1 [Lachancea quebecensis]|uniref:ATPase inhibitor, mitochondrial n=1 Tax=Lachancea quebecensis TaxID=1654605 RepID=A0A0P1L1K9_9SACH|nr:LAQU0S08e02366g1_1 [Lachancea quebecensis]
MLSQSARASLKKSLKLQLPAMPTMPTVGGRFYSEGSVGSPRGEGADDSFVRRERAQEDYFIRQHEKEQLEKLRQQVKQQQQKIEHLEGRLGDKLKDGQ